MPGQNSAGWKSTNTLLINQSVNIPTTIRKQTYCACILCKGFPCGGCRPDTNSLIMQFARFVRETCLPPNENEKEGMNRTGRRVQRIPWHVTHRVVRWSLSSLDTWNKIFAITKKYRPVFWGIIEFNI